MTKTKGIEFGGRLFWAYDVAESQTLRLVDPPIRIFLDGLFDLFELLSGVRLHFTLYVE